jgi:hypothetical protein
MKLAGSFRGVSRKGKFLQIAKRMRLLNGDLTFAEVDKRRYLSTYNMVFIVQRDGNDFKSMKKVFGNVY